MPSLRYIQFIRMLGYKSTKNMEIGGYKFMKKYSCLVDWDMLAKSHKLIYKEMWIHDDCRTFKSSN